MSIPLWVGIFYGILAAATIGILLYDGYRYPVCPQCGCNLCCKRIKGKIICSIHGEVERRKK